MKVKLFLLKAWGVILYKFISIFIKKSALYAASSISSKALLMHSSRDIGLFGIGIIDWTPSSYICSIPIPTPPVMATTGIFSLFAMLVMSRFAFAK